MKKKYMKKLVASFALLAMAAAMAGTSTFAWFSMNRNVAASGIGASARSDESLVIGRGLDVGSALSVTFSADDTRSGKSAIAPAQLNPSTWGENATGTVTGLKKMTGGSTDTSTGVTTGGTLVAVTNGGAADKYYCDYEVFLAARGRPLTGDLKVKFDTTTIDLLFNVANGYIGARSTVKAYTIAFFAQEVTADATNVFNGAPINTLSIADCFNGDGTTKEVNLGNFTFPVQTDAVHDRAIKVGMRLFLDGGLTVGATDYVDAGVTDLGAGTDGLIQSGKTYYTYEGDGVFAAASPGVGTSGAGYYVAASSSCYVYTDKVATDTFTFGLAFSVSGAAV